MGSFLRLFAAAFLMVLIFSHGMVADARTCVSKSNNFKGLCSRDTNCETVCQTEGFPGGDCNGFRRRCLCTRPC